MSHWGYKKALFFIFNIVKKNLDLTIIIVLLKIIE
jgi:hypothetical protein